jgi:hypothetical protein
MVAFDLLYLNGHQRAGRSEIAAPGAQGASPKANR